MPTTPGRRTARVPGLDELRLLTDLYGVSVGDVLGIEME